MARAPGAGIALGVSGPEAQAIAHRDGRVEVRVGTQDIGTGTRTVLAMVAAEEIGLPLSAVSARDRRYALSVFGSLGWQQHPPSNTPAIRQAAAHLKQKLFRIAAPMLGAEPGDLEMRDGVVQRPLRAHTKVAFQTCADESPAIRSRPQGERVTNYEGFRHDQAGCQFAEVEVDIETGVVRVLRVVAVHDAGLIIDPLTARSQVNGGVMMGVGFALFEDRRLDPQRG